MRNTLFIALVGLCFTFPGKVNATSLSSDVYTATCQLQDAPNRGLAERIFRYMQQELGYSYARLCSQYEKGEITIEKSSAGYRVLYPGGGVIIGIEETF